MKALVYTGPETLTYREEAEPQRQTGDILMRVEAVGVCGSDMHAYLGHDDRRPAPLILGHEATGIAEGGALDGKRVVVNPLVTCGVCEACTSGRSNVCPDRQIISIAPRQGAFAEKLAIPERNMVEVPDSLPPSKAALAEPLATGWHAVATAHRASFKPLAECRTLVIGGGAIGMASALSLRARGVEDIWIAETNPLRRATASGTGRVFNPIDGNDVGENGADLVIDCVGGGRTRELASASVAPGGTIIHVGLQDQTEGLDIRKITLQEVTLVGTYTYTMQDFRETVEAMASGALGPLDWTEERSLADGAQAFADLRDGNVAAAKIVLHPEN